MGNRSSARIGNGRSEKYGAPSSTMMGSQQCLEEKEKLDSHENERAAVEIDHSFDRLSAEQQRRYCSQVAEFLDVIFPRSLAQGLSALEFGEVLPIVKKAKVNGGKRNYTERMAQLQALKYIEYERGKGSLVGKAREVVGSHFGVDTEAIRKWDGPLRKSLGDSYVSRELTRAFEDGGTENRFRNHPNAEGIESFAESRAIPTLTQAGKRFKQSLKDKKK
jgi:hypothetical protein